jgi:hypothetical protein
MRRLLVLIVLLAVALLMLLQFGPGLVFYERPILVTRAGAG